MSDTVPNIPREDFLALFQDVAASITSSLDLEETLELIVRRTAEAFDVWECDLFEYSPETDSMTGTAMWSRAMTEADREWLGTTVCLDDWPAYRVALEQGLVVDERVDDADLDEVSRAIMLEWGETAVLTVPLKFGDQILGCLSLVEKGHERRFTPEEHEALRSLAVPVAIAVHNARMYRRQEQRARHLTSLADASRAITSSVVLEDVLELVTERAAKALGSPQCLIYEYDPERDAIVSRALYEAPGCEDPDYEGLGTVYSLDDYPSDRAILDGRRIVEEHLGDNEIFADSRESMDLHGEKSCLTAPLYYRDQPLGTLVLIETEHERRFTPEEVELIQALAEQAAIAIHNARLFRRQELQNRRLVALAEVSRAISASLNAEEVLARVCSAVGAFFFEAPTEADVWLRDGHGFVPFRARLSGSDDISPRTPDKLVAQMLGKWTPAQNGDSRRGRRLVVPLVVNRAVEGYLDIRCRRRSRLSDDEIQVVEILVGHAAVALENAQNYGKLESMYLETVRALAAAIEAKDHYTAEHGDMLANMAIAVGRRLGLDDDALRDLRYAAVLHDIGKIGIPGHILNKPDRLTDEEFAVMAEHTIIGERIISHIDYLAPIAGIIRSAHERWDGRGYPDKLAAEHIPLESRILLVCDAYHAMTSDRPYRTALSDDLAIEELRRNTGSQFDPLVIEAFLDAWPRFDGSELAAGASSRARALVN
jgi:HD-GYP domain-containing protein (c-di-GMP phosphodiesterase class II)